jgi:hypothetical protein
MAHEAFALSPISARAAQPSEADYEAIREAFVRRREAAGFRRVCQTQPPCRYPHGA